MCYCFIRAWYKNFFSKRFRPQPATLLKKRLCHRCFTVNFAKFLRMSILQNTSGRLLLAKWKKLLIDWNEYQEYTGWEVSPALSQKMKKSTLIVAIYGLNFSFKMQFLSFSRRKNQKYFPFLAFLSCAIDEMFIKVP